MIFLGTWFFCHCILFADDTTLYFSHKDTKYLQWYITHDLAILADWFRANKLTLNIDKSVLLLFKHGNSQFEINKIKFDGMVIPRHKSTKFLGIHIDDKLSWKEHFNNLMLKLKRNIQLLSTIKN